METEGQNLEDWLDSYPQDSAAAVGMRAAEETHAPDLGNPADQALHEVRPSPRLSERMSCCCMLWQPTERIKLRGKVLLLVCAQ